MANGTGDAPPAYVRRAGPFQDAGKLVERCARRDDIIDDGDARAAQVPVADESSTDVSGASLPRQCGLRRRFHDTAAEIGGNLGIAHPPHQARDFLRLVETAFPQSGRGQRHWNDEVSSLIHCCGQCFSKRPARNETASILERVYQGIDRERIHERRDQPVEAGRLGQARPALPTMREWRGALIAQRLYQPRELP